MKNLLLLLIAFILISTAALAQGSKLDFWNKQRKGANWFNRIPTKEWLIATRQANLEVIRLAPDKWKSAQRDFLIGDADQYKGIVEQDFAKLKEVLDAADELGIKIILTPLSLPGLRWRQQNGNKEDFRLWKESQYLSQAANFWKDLAGRLKGHPAIVGYNILNEPHPELATGFEQGGGDFIKWYARVKDTAADLNRFNAKIVEAIREVDKETPIVIDSGLWASPAAISYLTPLKDDKVLYSVHMYEIYEFTSQKPINQQASYPGKIFKTVDDKKVEVVLDRKELENILRPVMEWQKKYKVAANRIIVGEFGCQRKVKGAANYLEDLIQIFNQQSWHWAFYAFREDVWDAMDYELGTGPVPAGYWQMIEKGETPNVTRTDNPIWAVFKKALKQ
jgi:endoglucanase